MPDCIDPGYPRPPTPSTVVPGTGTTLAVPTYLPASWKGIPFVCTETDDEFGRRGHLYEYPLSERVAWKDLGRKARRFKVTGYLIGGDQIAQTGAMAAAAESPEPGILIHPAYGSQRVACIKLSTSLDYFKDVRRTRLSFEFVEAADSMAPYRAGSAIAMVHSIASAAIAAAALGVWNVNERSSPSAGEVATTISLALARLLQPVEEEDAFDAISALERGAQRLEEIPYLPGQPRLAMGFPVAPRGALYSEFMEVLEPIDHGSAIVRLVHADALERLREFNKQVVDAGISGNLSVETLVIAARLVLARDYALVAIATTYRTVSEALQDLDFIMAIYDEEEAAATRRCDDKLVAAIRAARAEAAQAMLSANIRLPGIVEYSVHGVWPSLLAAHKVYGDGTRYEEVEHYNPVMPPFFIGREATVPAR